MKSPGKLQGFFCTSIWVRPKISRYNYDPFMSTNYMGMSSGKKCTQYYYTIGF